MIKRTSRSGFTLVELLIVITILTLLSTLIVGINIRATIQKGRDSKRKQDLNKLVRYLEDYNNDFGRYPPGDQASGTIENAPWGGLFASYGSNLPQDPQAPAREYFYQTDPDWQNMFVIYVLLENESDDDIARSGCTGGCGPNRTYNYAVYSPNVVMVDGAPTYEGSTLGVSTQPSYPPSSPPGAGCEFGQCGYCSRCGGPSGQDCGALSRCGYQSGSWFCRFDLGCIR